MNRLNRGFTIIELLVVLAIIGVITVLVFQQVTNARAKQRDQERTQDINVINANLQEMISAGQSQTDGILTSFTCGNTTGCPTLLDPQSSAGATYRINATATTDGTALAAGGANPISGTGVCAVLERGTSIGTGNGIQVIRQTSGLWVGRFLYCGNGNF